MIQCVFKDSCRLPLENHCHLLCHPDNENFVGHLDKAGGEQDELSCFVTLAINKIKAWDATLLQDCQQSGRSAVKFKLHFQVQHGNWRANWFMMTTTANVYIPSKRALKGNDAEPPMTPGML